jgi:nickel superoxide dismutase
VAVGLVVSLAQAHCQIPCGIYDDDARLAEIAEHITTIEKAMLKIEEHGAERKPNYNQIVRWTVNKEAHATELMEIVTAYFMTQRVKPAAKSDAAAYGTYVEQVTLLHQMLVSAMKAKQTTDTAHTKQLSKLLEDFTHAYGSKAHTH